MSKFRILNGYVVLFSPNHPSSMQNENWKGWIYEHILVAESLIGRRLNPNECVHHLDCDKTNNSPDNLLVIDRGQHAKIHTWIEKGAPIIERDSENGVNSGKPKDYEPPKTSKNCKNCGTFFFNLNKSVKYCSHSCATFSTRKVDRPSKSDLEKLIWEKPFTEIGKDYGVSDNTIRKWCKAYGIKSFPPVGYWLKSKATLKQAE